MARVFQILLRQEKSTNRYNPLLMDLDEMRRWRVVLEVVRRMATGEAPDPFPTREVIALNYETLFAKGADSEGSCAFVAAEQPPFDESEWEAALAEAGSGEMLDRLFMKYVPGGWCPSFCSGGMTKRTVVPVASTYEY